MVAIAGDGTLDPNVRVRRVNQLLDRGVPVRTPRDAAVSLTSVTRIVLAIYSTTHHPPYSPHLQRL
jgi:hypothetical protein